MSKIEIGQTVKVLKNNAKVPEGSIGKVRGFSAVGGLALVDVEGWGRTAIGLRNLEPCEARPGLKAITSEATSWERSGMAEATHAIIHPSAPPKILSRVDSEPVARAEKPKREYYLNAADTCEELGITHARLYQLRTRAKIGRCAPHGSCFFTEGDVETLYLLDRFVMGTGLTMGRAMSLLKRYSLFRDAFEELVSRLDVGELRG